MLKLVFLVILVAVFSIKSSKSDPIPKGDPDAEPDPSPRKYRVSGRSSVWSNHYEVAPKHKHRHRERSSRVYKKSEIVRDSHGRPKAIHTVYHHRSAGTTQAPPPEKVKITHVVTPIKPQPKPEPRNVPEPPKMKTIYVKETHVRHVPVVQHIPVIQHVIRAIQVPIKSPQKSEVKLVEKADTASVVLSESPVKQSSSAIHPVAIMPGDTSHLPISYGFSNSFSNNYGLGSGGFGMGFGR